MENNNRAGHAQINARRDCVDLASAGSGRRSENPPALAVGSVNEFVKKEDLHIINRALNNGSDVKIQLTKDGYRITEDTMKVLKRVAISQEKMEK